MNIWVSLIFGAAFFAGGARGLCGYASRGWPFDGGMVLLSVFTMMGAALLLNAAAMLFAYVRLGRVHMTVTPTNAYPGDEVSVTVRIERPQHATREVTLALIEQKMDEGWTDERSTVVARAAGNAYSLCTRAKFIVPASTKLSSQYQRTLLRAEVSGFAFAAIDVVLTLQREGSELTLPGRITVPHPWATETNLLTKRKRPWFPRIAVALAALALLSWGASTAVANPQLQDHWLVEQIRAVVNVVAKLLPANVVPTEAAPAVPSVAEALAVGNKPISQFDSITRTFSFQDKIGSTRANVSGHWDIEADRLVVYLDSVDADYASVGCKWTKCDAITHLQLRLQNVAGERQAADEGWDWRGTAVPVEPPIKLGERRRLADISFEIPLLPAAAGRGGAKGLARSSLPFLQPRIELGDAAKDSQQGMLPLGLLRGLPFASSTVPEGRKPPCAREPSVNEAIAWGCPVELVSAVAVLSDAPKTTENAPVNVFNRKLDAPGRYAALPPLIAAIVAADEVAVAALIAAGADVNLVTDEGETPLASAVWRGSKPIVEMLLNADTNVKLVINQDNGKRIRTALHSAAYESDADMARLLINRGADATARAETGWTPLALALAAPYGTELVKAMVKSSADVNRPTPFASNAHWGGQPANALLIAISYNSHQTVRYLLSIGADPTLPGPWGFPVGHFAPFYGFTETMDALRESGVDLLKPIAADRPHAGATYLMHAVHGGKMHSVDYMLRLGADPKQKDAQGKTAFDHAVDYRHVAIAAKLKLL